MLNILITAAQVLGGLYSGSLSLLSDALHNLSDVISLVISYIASILTRKEQTVKRTFGYKRAEIIAAFVNTLVLIIVAVFLAIEAIKRFQHPHEIGSFWVITLSIMAIIINGISAVLLHSDARHNLNIRSAYLHLLSDTITSVAVLFAGIIMYFFKIFWIDGVLTLIISVYLIIISLKLLMESMKVLMLFTPSQVILEHINERICAIPKVQNIHHVHVWQLDTDQICFEGHVDLTEDLPLQKVNTILEEIREILHDEFNIDHVTLQPEFNLCDKKDLISQAH
jgi:cobalt-zinc-cadmium efflux system protein